MLDPAIQIYRIKPACSIMGVSKPTLYRMVKAGKLQLVKLGPRSSGITRKSIEALLAAA